MTQSANEFPGTISLQALQQLQKCASSEPMPKASVDQLSQEDVERISLEILDDITDKFSNHMIPKVLCMRLINQMIVWAQENQDLAGKDNDLETFAAFNAMCAQLVAAGIAIQNTYFGPDDFTHPSNNQE